MAGDWIKFETATLTKPEVLKLARITGLDRHAIVGRLLVFWTWCDTNAVDGVVDACVDATVDALVDAPGFALALQRVGWLEIDNDAERLTIPKFDRHNGKSAKNRVLKTERQRKWREKSVDASVDGGVSTREEKRREEIEERKKQAKKKADDPDGARKRAPVFSKPTTNEVAAYCTERGNNVDPVAFVDYYESVNWHVGKKRMSDWKAAVRTWEKRNAENQRTDTRRKSAGQNAADFADHMREIAAREVGSRAVREAAGALRLSLVPAMDDDGDA